MILTVLLLGVGCAAAVEQASPGQRAGDVEMILAEYNSWTAMFETPRNVSAFLAALCRSMTADEEQYMTSPHAQHAVQVYVNPTGVETILQAGKRIFPEQTVIVKEKWAQAASAAPAAGEPEPAGLGIMIKRAKGFDTQGGDWEYLYVDGQGQVTRDQKQLENCRACHSAQAVQDSVFYPALQAN